MMLAFVASVTSIQAQSNMESVLESIAKNNKTVQVAEQYWKAKQLEYRTGNAPDDPIAGYDFLAGSAGAGNQTEVLVAQTFDFPTVYAKRKQLADEKVAQTEFQLLAVKQDVLLEARKRCIQLVYQQKLQTQLDQRKQNTERLLSDFKKSQQNGTGNAMDVAKAELQLLSEKKRSAENEAIIADLNTKLNALNGGIEIVFTDTVYPLFPEVPSFEEIEQELEKNDAVREVLLQQQNVVEKQIQLSKANWFPKLDAGFRHVSGFGQSFNGVHTGISLPLWANRNTVKQQKATLQYTQLNLDEHLNEHHHKKRQLYDRYLMLKESKQQYEVSLAAINSEKLLNRSLEIGHISTIEYFMEMNYLNEALNGYLQTEGEYYQAVAELLRYR